MQAWEWEVVIHTTRMAKSSKITITRKLHKSERSLVSSITMRRPMLATIQSSIGQWLSLRTMPDTRVSGSSARTFVKAKVNRSGQMAPCMKDGGKKTKLMAKVDLSMPMETSTMDNGSTTKPMDLVSTAILMEPSTKDTGRRISSMETDWRPGQMVPSTKVSTFKARKMERVDSPGLTDPPIMEFSTKTIFKEQANTTGPMEESTTVYG